MKSNNFDVILGMIYWEILVFICIRMNLLFVTNKNFA